MADKAYDADARVLQLLADSGVETVIPPKFNRKEKRGYDVEKYKARHLIENFLESSSSIGRLLPDMTRLPEIFLGLSILSLQLSGLIDDTP